MKTSQVQRVVLAGFLSPIALLQSVGIALALPPAEDMPEEVLRTQIILDARSPIDGKPMTPAEYAVLQTKQQTPYQPPSELSPQVKGVVGLLKFRKFVKTFLPFIPIK
uniref:Glutathione S-transferase n=1 Tax=Oscillatoriales cyanobacterium SpSt-402 TaxID=2282168 RepID=A0A832H4A2_9CYAN